MDSPLLFFDTLIVKSQNVTDTIAPVMLKCSMESTSTETNGYDSLICFYICVAISLFIIIAAILLGLWFRTKWKLMLTKKDREHWIALKKEYQQLALEYIKTKKTDNSEESLYLEYINNYIRQIDEHLTIKCKDKAIDINK